MSRGYGSEFNDLSDAVTVSEVTLCGDQQTKEVRTLDLKDEEL